MKPHTADPAWLKEARRHIGLAEIPGKAHNGTITNWLIALGAWWRDDETPWCGTFVAHCCRETNRGLPQHWYRAKDWLNTGTKLLQPAVGAVAVFERKGGGHVGFVVGKDRLGNLMILGGNQGNAVNIRPFARDRALGFIWPQWANGRKSFPYPERYDLPLLHHVGGVSKNEA